MRAIHWFRADLRLADNLALESAARHGSALLPLFVLDPVLLEASGAARVCFLLDCLARLGSELETRGSGLLVRRGDPTRIVPAVAHEVGASRVTWGRDVSPYARRRDAAVARQLATDGREARVFEDRVVLGADEVTTRAGGPYAVYSPYRRAWWRRYIEAPVAPSGRLRLPPLPPGVRADAVPAPADLGIEPPDARLPTGGTRAARRRLAAFLDGPARDYDAQRDLPAVDGTSRLSPYLRFGAISARECVAQALALGEAEPRAAAAVRGWVDELIWRDFYSAILAHNPHVLGGAHRREYDALEWDDDPAALAAWRDGRTGFPFVDAAMRQLAATGWMHNRARMVVASFLTKDLGIDWRSGERIFMERLVDGDPASNNGGWQWSASTGTDAQPYFRIFNPVAQGERFDPDGAYIARWVPELRRHPAPLRHQPWRAPLETSDYPPRICDHAERRERALRRYRVARAAGAGAKA